jgi:dTDP-L-rhamnose 4-epimerase
MRVLVTGGAGFIGSHTVDRLLSEGHEVRILDNLQKPVHLKGKPDYIPAKAEFILGDVRNKKDLEAAMRDIDAIFHFAAYQDYLPDFSMYFHVNCVSTAMIYEIIVEKKLPVKKVIVASSQAVLGEGLYRCAEHGELIPDIRLEEQLSKGDWEHHCPHCGKYMVHLPTPETRINPQNQYALSKHSQEGISMNLGKRYEIPSVALRYSIVQGPRQSFYIDNDDANYQCFNVGGGTGFTVLEFYNKVQGITGKQIVPITEKYYRYGDTRHIRSDISKLKALNWKPLKSIEESISGYWEYLKIQTDIDDILEYAEKTMKTKGVVRSVQ